MKYSILSKKNETSFEIQKRIAVVLDNNGFVFDEENPELVIVIGGDGTFLKAVHKYIAILDKVYFVGVKTGALGYFFEFDNNKLDDLLDSLINNGESHFVEYSLLGADLLYENNSVKKIYAVNEIRIENPFRTLVSEVYINDELLETFRGNGLLVSSTLGSTGYNKSCKGAVVDPTLDLLQLSEVNAINNNSYSSLQNSLVLNSTSRITFKGEFDKEIIGYDNKINESDNRLLSIDIYISDKKVRILRFRKLNFIKKLKASFIKEWFYESISNYFNRLVTT